MSAAGRAEDEGEGEIEMSSKKQEFTTRPGHYPAIAGVESIRIMETFNFNLGNAMKYIWRCGQKPGETPVHDLRKAIQYLEFEIARIERDGE